MPYFWWIKQWWSVLIESRLKQWAGSLKKKVPGSPFPIQLEQESITLQKDFQTKTDYFYNPLCSSAVPALLARVKFAEKGQKSVVICNFWTFLCNSEEQVSLTTRREEAPCISIRLWQSSYLDLAAVWSCCSSLPTIFSISQLERVGHLENPDETNTSDLSWSLNAVFQFLAAVL